MSSIPMGLAIAFLLLSFRWPVLIWAVVPALLSVGQLPWDNSGGGVGAGGEVAKLLLLALLLVGLPRIPPHFLLLGAAYVSVLLVVAILAKEKSAAPIVALTNGLVPVLGAGAALGASRTAAGAWFLRGFLVLQAVTLLQIVTVYNGLGIPFLGGEAYKQYVVVGVGASNTVGAIACLGMALALAWPAGLQVPSRAGLWISGIPIVLLSMSKWSLVVLAVLALVGLASALLQSTRVGLSMVVGAFLAVVVLRGYLYQFESLSEIRLSGLSIGSYSSGVGRLSLWNAYWTEFLESPLSGQGLGWTDVSVFGVPFLAHNVFLQLMAEGGMLLLATFFSVVTWLTVRALHLRGARILILLGVALLSSALEPALDTPRYGTLFFIAMGFLANHLFHGSGIGRALQVSRPAFGDGQVPPVRGHDSERAPGRRSRPNGLSGSRSGM